MDIYGSKVTNETIEWYHAKCQMNHIYYHNIMNIKQTLFTLIILLSATAASAQQTLFDANEICSPEVRADGTVTFRLYAPKAIRVQITGDFLPQVKVASPFGEVEANGTVDMEEHKDGTWSYTAKGLAPELYSYKFKVDGMDYLDPSNVYMCRDIASYMNIFIVEKEAGDKGDLYSVNDVPHGNVSRVWYDSPTLNMKRRMTIYTPAGYDKGGKYPVLYLLHGSGGDEEAWITLGRTAQIMDNLIASGKINPMIVVMPNGNANSEAAPGEWSKGMYKPSFRAHVNPKPIATLEESFPDIITYVETHYNVLKGKKNRAICGLSMGGRQTFAISKRYPDKFDYIGLFSAAIYTEDDRGERIDLATMESDPKFQQEMKTLFAGKPKLYWVGIGSTDFLYSSNKDYRKYLDAKGYPYEYLETDGGHIWRNWRLYLTVFTQKLFK